MCGDEPTFKGMIGELYRLCAFVLDYYLTSLRTEESTTSVGAYHV